MLQGSPRSHNSSRPLWRNPGDCERDVWLDAMYNTCNVTHKQELQARFAQVMGSVMVSTQQVMTSCTSHINMLCHCKYTTSDDVIHVTHKQELQARFARVMSFVMVSTQQVMTPYTCDVINRSYKRGLLRSCIHHPK